VLLSRCGERLLGIGDGRVTMDHQPWPISDGWVIGHSIERPLYWLKRLTRT
jgi:hypothetical protein